jgi:hypothetical protein
VWSPKQLWDNPGLGQANYFKLVSKFLGCFAITEQGASAVMRLGPSVLGKILDKPKLRRIEIKTDFFELDDKIEKLFKSSPIQTVVREAYIQAFANA